MGEDGSWDDSDEQDYNDDDGDDDGSWDDSDEQDYNNDDGDDNITLRQWQLLVVVDLLHDNH